MGVREVLVAVELVGGYERTLLHFVKDVLHVDEAAPLEVDGAHELLDEHRQVETVGVESSEVAAGDELFERPGDLREGRTILHILVGDAVNGGRLFGDVYAGVDLAGLDDLLAVGHHLDHRDLDDTVFGGVDAGGFQIEKDDGTFEVQFHASVFLRNSPRIRSSASAALLRKVSEASFTLSATASPSTSSNVSSTRVQTSSA